MGLDLYKHFAVSEGWALGLLDYQVQTPISQTCCAKPIPPGFTSLHIGLGSRFQRSGKTLVGCTNETVHLQRPPCFTYTKRRLERSAALLPGVSETACSNPTVPFAVGCMRQIWRSHVAWPHGLRLPLL